MDAVQKVEVLKPIPVEHLKGSVLGPLLFSIYLNDLLISVDDIEICNYADATTLYTCDQNLQNRVERLENVSLK